MLPSRLLVAPAPAQTRCVHLTLPQTQVLILDWDVHHGNGTEDIFYNTDDVLYISTHQQGLWPYTGERAYCMQAMSLLPCCYV